MDQSVTFQDVIIEYICNDCSVLTLFWPDIYFQSMDLSAIQKSFYGRTLCLTTQLEKISLLCLEFFFLLLQVIIFDKKMCKRDH